MPDVFLRSPITDRFLPVAPANDFLDHLDMPGDWQPIRSRLEAMSTAENDRLPPLAVFKMLFLAQPGVWNVWWKTKTPFHLSPRPP